MKNYAYFWGCYIPARFPFVEKSIRLIFERLGLEARDIEGTTCCPERSLIKNMSPEVWYLTAARNLCLAEEQDCQWLTPCNGCYGTLKCANIDLKVDAKLRHQVNEKLSRINRRFKGTTQVKHLIEVLYDDIGTDKIKSVVQKPLNGLNIAVHNGCHLTRPSNIMFFDNPLRPTKFDGLVEALEAKSVDYKTKLLCCGGTLSGVGSQEESIAMMREKLLELKELQVDALTTCCPECFRQYDSMQYFIQRRGEDINIPVFYFSELLGLALGIEPAELGVNMHRIDTTPFVNKWLKKTESLSQAQPHFDLLTLRKCYECGACVDDCPVAQEVSTFDPKAIIGKVLEGKIDELLESQEIWMCLECYTCYELCPQHFSLMEVFQALKNLAISRGIIPRAAKMTIETFTKTGKFSEPQIAQRKKLQLPEFPKSGAEELKKLIS